MPQDTITNRNGQLSYVTGKGVEVFKLRALASALRFRQKTGMEIDSRIKCRVLAKRETGLKTNDFDKLIAAVEAKMNALIAECEIINE